MFEKPYRPTEEQKDTVGKQMIRLAEKFDDIGVGEVRKIVERLDANVLGDLFHEKLKRSDVGNNLLKLVSKNSIKIYSDNKDERIGFYKPGTHEVSLNEATIKLSAMSVSEFMINNDLVPEGIEVENLYPYLCKEVTKEAFIHEQCHAVTDNDCVMEKNITLWKIGLRKTKTEVVGNEERILDLGVMINEGFTEIIAFEILSEYEKRTGDVPSSVSKAYEKLPLEVKSGYARFVIAAEQYMIFISTLTEVPYEVVRNSLIRAYLKSEDVTPDELVIALLENGYEYKEVSDLASNITFMDNPENLKKSIVSAVAKLDIDKRRSYLDLINNIIKPQFLNPKTGNVYNYQ